MKIKPIKGYWIAIGKVGISAPWSISATKKGCVSNFLEDGIYNENEVKKMGWSFRKVNITIELFKP